MSIEAKEKEGAVLSTKTTGDFRPSRRSLSPVSKVALGGFLTGAILCGAVTLVVTLTGGHALTLLITTLAFLAGAIFIATRIRWMPLLSILISGLLFYLIFTEPYVVDSLFNPKTDPQGGFGHFVGDITIIVSLLIAFVGSVGATVQNYRQNKQQAVRWFPSALSVIAGMAIGAILIAAVAQAAPATTGTAYVNGVPAVHLSAGAFLQSSVTISKGSKLMLIDDVSSLHVLANGSWKSGAPNPMREPGAPVISNIQVSGSTIAIGPFPVAGTYHIYCEVHQGMNLTIIVQ
ncbi:MAG: hypothetical protein H0V70_27500 [Ktedonobacteraceae bacterium]|nr:hypothetical protein [Ktedonobacteraceae bacterium]